MAKTDFPLVSIKVPGVEQKFNLSDPATRLEYFEAKAGPEIKKLKEYLDKNTFIAYLLGKKNSGKGTYTKMLMEVFGSDKVAHISIGDLVRATHVSMEDETKKAELIEYLKNNYRGYISVEQAIDALLGRDTKTLLPTEFIMALLKWEIDKMPKKALFIDGFPRDLDQVSYSLFFRNLIDYRSDPDIFVAIQIPEAVIDERMKTRVVCPICKTPRSLKLLATKTVGFDEATNSYYLMCDNPDCNKAKMVGKEGDELGIEAIRERLELDEKLIQKILELEGVSKVLLRNAIPAAKAPELVDDYELTPEFYYERGADGAVEVKEKPWTVKDDEGVESYSLMAPAVVVSMIKQLSQVLGL